MSKNIKIAALGIAALATAAAPMMAMAEGEYSVGNNGTIKDTIALTIEDNCTFSRQATPHSAGTWDPTNTADDKVAQNVLNGQTYDAFAKSDFHVVCNNKYGYQVTVATTGFTADTLRTAAEAWNYNGGAYADSGSSWFISSSHAGASLSGDNRIVAKTTQSLTNAGEDFTVTYNAKVSETQQADTYTATATYTFAELES